MADANDLRLVPGNRVPMADRVAIMNTAYAGYYIPIQVNQVQMALMDEFYDIVPRRSVVAYVGSEPVGQAYIALRDDQAWISGVGVVPAWRRRGVARAMVAWLLDSAREAGARSALLEVIDRNVAAHGLYRSLGFADGRELLGWERRADADPLPLPTPEQRLRAAAPAELLNYHQAWHDRPASWQRSEASLRSMVRHLAGFRLDMDGRPAAYGLVAADDDSVAIMDAGINPDAGLLMPGRLLFQGLSTLYLGYAMTIANVAADDPLNRILAGLGFIVTLRQWEMQRDL
jgi:ribosomal protein S18 acetylase RimI-like enzyme